MTSKNTNEEIKEKCLRCKCNKLKQEFVSLNTPNKYIKICVKCQIYKRDYFKNTFKGTNHYKARYKKYNI